MPLLPCRLSLFCWLHTGSCSCCLTCCKCGPLWRLAMRRLPPAACSSAGCRACFDSAPSCQPAGQAGNGGAALFSRSHKWRHAAARGLKCWSHRCHGAASGTTGRTARCRDSQPLGCVRPADALGRPAGLQHGAAAEYRTVAAAVGGGAARRVDPLQAPAVERGPTCPLSAALGWGRRAKLLRRTPHCPSPLHSAARGASGSSRAPRAQLGSLRASPQLFQPCPSPLTSPSGAYTRRSPPQPTEEPPGPATSRQRQQGVAARIQQQSGLQAP